MSNQRQHAGSAARRGAPKVPSGFKANARDKDRMQIALRPKTRTFHQVSAWAAEWGVSWNEAALRLLDAGLARQ